VNADSVIQIGQQALWVTLLISAPMLIAGLVVGLLISMLQAVTQIQEVTLTFAPKIIAVFVVFALFLPWMSQYMVQYFRELVLTIPSLSP
jgi:flagellar biosynthetic protein FliQ